MNDPVILRNYAPDDERYVFGTWLRDLREADYSGLPDDLWFDAHREFIKRLLADPKVAMVVAATADDPNEILGYAVAEPNEVLLWVQVKKKFRGVGLAKRMLEAVQAPATVGMLWRTRSSTARLKNPHRSRLLRQRFPAATPNAAK